MLVIGAGLMSIGCGGSESGQAQGVGVDGGAQVADKRQTAPARTMPHGTSDQQHLSWSVPVIGLDDHYDAVDVYLIVRREKEGEVSGEEVVLKHAFGGFDVLRDMENFSGDTFALDIRIQAGCAYVGIPEIGMGRWGHVNSLASLAVMDVVRSPKDMDAKGGEVVLATWGAKTEGETVFTSELLLKVAAEP